MEQTALPYNNHNIFQYLRQLGCCERCSLRYIGVRDPFSFNDVAFCLKLKGLDESKPSTDAPVAKVMRKNPCIVCLGLLEDYTTDLMVQKVTEEVSMAKYDCDSFACAISLPICIQLRAHSLWVHLTEKFIMNGFKQETHVTPLKEAWKWIVAPVISSAINKELDSGAVCDFFIEISMNYIGEEEECACLLEMHPNTFKHRERQKRRYHGTVFTRKAVEVALLGTETSLFRRYCESPPTVPDEPIVCDRVVCAHNSMFIAGRYNKFSRELSQTPWLVEGERRMESSVQDLICKDLQAAVEADSFKFSSSGREDVDVRMLGRGRPFVCELLNPRHVKISRVEIRAVERGINGNSQMVAVRDLQVVFKDELVHLKTGEEKKTKRYRALCVGQTELSQDWLDSLLGLRDITISQKTPIRVLHRRPLATRTKLIHAMKAVLLPMRSKEGGCLFTLELTTQAGTYIKEFVHGDFGRTQPSLGGMLGDDLDILALDVEEIELDWPPSINYEKDE